MVIAKVRTSESVACPLRELPHLHLHLHLQLDLDPIPTSVLPTASRLAHSALAYWLPANWSAVFIELYVERGVQAGREAGRGGRLACQAEATAARTTRTTSLTRPEIRLSIINNLISPNWRELATRQCHSRRRSRRQSPSKGRAGILAGVEGFL